MAELSLDDFLGHSTRAPGNRGSRTLSWRKRQPPILDFWFHTRTSLVSLWGHGFPRIVEREVDGEKVREIWGGRFNCWEPEDTCKSQYRRNDDGTRKVPPKVCPMCLLIEYLHAQVRAKRISWVDPVFRFQSDDDTQTLTVGGMLGLFNGDLSRDQLIELKKAGIRRDEAWKEAANAKCSYLFCGVDHSEPEKGPQVLIETTALGDAVKRVIRDQIEGMGSTDGNPMLRPYAIRFQYKPNEQEFSKKYNALPLPKVEMTPAVRAAIYDADKPDISEHIARGNIASLRSAMEAAALLELPWDAIFGPAEALEDGDEEPWAPKPAEKASAKAPGRPVQGGTAPQASHAPKEEQKPAQAPARRRAASPTPATPKMPDYPPGTVLLPCEKCGAKMADTDTVCWKCGAKYELDDEPPAPAAPLARPKPAAVAEEDSSMPWPGEDGDSEVGF